ncbi:MAG: hypothetical protein JRH20_21195, partial [Deltaproteobacteria bacterium]|nr:hypothetical protein [Deltaproteobacteria bacterium]
MRILILCVLVQLAACSRMGFQSGDAGTMERDTLSTHTDGTGTVDAEQSPIARDDGPIIVAEDAASTAIPVLTNDLLPLGNNTRIIAVGAADQAGTITIGNDGLSLSYTPKEGFHGVEHFTYRIQGSGLEAADASVRVHVLNPFTWTGDGRSPQWAVGANWCGEVVQGNCAGGAPPSSSDTAIFDGTCLRNCSALISAPIQVLGIAMAADYGGSLTQGAPASLQLGSEGWRMAGGEFIGGSADISSAGPLLIDGGEFQSTQGLLTLGRSACGTMTLLRVGAAASFLHGLGTLRLAETRPLTSSCMTWAFIDAAPDLELFNMEFISSATSGGWYTRLATPNEHPITIHGRFVHGGNLLNLHLLLHGDLHVGSNSLGGTGSVALVGTGTQGYSGTGLGTKLIVDKPSGDVQPTEPTQSFWVLELGLKRSTFHAPETRLTLGQTDCEPRTALEVAPGATFVAIDTGRFSNGSCAPTTTIDVPAGFVFPHLRVDGEASVPGWHGAFASAGIGELVVSGHFSHGAGRLNLDVSVGGDYSIGSNADAGDGAISLTGGGSQAINALAGGTASGGTLRINKGGGVVTQGSALQLTASSQGLHLVNGT